MTFIFTFRIVKYCCAVCHTLSVGNVVIFVKCMQLKKKIPEGKTKCGDFPAIEFHSENKFRSFFIFSYRIYGDYSSH